MKMGTIIDEDGATVYMPAWFYLFALAAMVAVGAGLEWALA